MQAVVRSVQASHDHAEPARSQSSGVRPVVAMPPFGNQAHLRSLTRIAPRVQAKLIVGSAHDPLEREADQVADKVMRMADPAPPVVRRACAACEEEEARTLRPKAEGQTLAAGGAAPPIVSQALQSPGKPLDRGSRAFFEPRFGSDLGSVRLHDDAVAAASARAVGALAYAAGNHIVLDPARSDLTSNPGRRLLAHEIAHVLQQEGQPSTLVQRACGPAQIATPASVCAGVSGDVDGDTFLFVVNCDDFRPDTPARKPGGAGGEEAALRDAVSGIESGDAVEIHGFASEEGDADFNVRLSCARAVKANSVLTAALAAASKTATLKLFAHGATGGARDQRRSVVVRVVKPAPAPKPEPNQTPQTYTFVPCATAPQLLGTRGGCGSGTDFTFYDFPTLTPADEATVKPYRAKPDAELLSLMKTTLGGLAQSEGIAAADHFASGTGTKVTHAAGTRLGDAAAKSSEVAAAVTTIQSALKAAITAAAATGTVDCAKLSLPGSALPTISFTFSPKRPLDSAALKAVIGGTQGLTVHIMSLTLTPSTGAYAAQLQLVICDDFGVDQDDLYAEPLDAFWVLQHERKGFKPFINEIIVVQSVNDSI